MISCHLSSTERKEECISGIWIWYHSGHLCFKYIEALRSDLFFKDIPFTCYFHFYRIVLIFLWKSIISKQKSQLVKRNHMKICPKTLTFLMRLERIHIRVISNVWLLLFIQISFQIMKIIFLVFDTGTIPKWPVSVVSCTFIWTMEFPGKFSWSERCTRMRTNLRIAFNSILKVRV